MSPDIIVSPGLVHLAPRFALQGALSNKCIVSFHPSGGAPCTGQQRQGARRQGLSTLQERDLGRREELRGMEWWACACVRERDRDRDRPSFWCPQGPDWNDPDCSLQVCQRMCTYGWRSHSWPSAHAPHCSWYLPETQRRKQQRLTDNSL